MVRGGPFFTGKSNFDPLPRGLILFAHKPHDFSPFLNFRLTDLTRSLRSLGGGMRFLAWWHFLWNEPLSNLRDLCLEPVGPVFKSFGTCGTCGTCATCLAAACVHPTGTCARKFSSPAAAPTLRAAGGRPTTASSASPAIASSSCSYPQAAGACTTTAHPLNWSDPIDPYWSGPAPCPRPYRLGVPWDAYVQSRVWVISK